MKEIVIIFPHQLFEFHPAFEMDVHHYVLVEEYLFFRQYHFHKSKLVYHRATMKMYADYLRKKGKDVQYIESNQADSDVRKLIPQLSKVCFSTFITTQLYDDWLEKRWEKSIKKVGSSSVFLASPMLLNNDKDRNEYMSQITSFHQNHFYIYQRKKRNILLTPDQKPVGEKWSFDGDNRKKYPKGKKPPIVDYPKENEFLTEASAYINTHFVDNPGHISKPYYYPVTFEDAKRYFFDFLDTRMYAFGDFEDAIVKDESILHHSVLTPMLNTGLLTPSFILNHTLSCKNIPLNSLEGFVRQIIGWREFMALVYIEKGVMQRRGNFWNHHRKIPKSFYDGSTGIEPIDQTIKKVLQTGYCHHIERLMILGNFMLLCEFHPDEVYRWFMELFIDAYDWVMVPNIYGMSQFADGGLFATKPYISGSNYILKMSDYTKGPWTKIWDALFWNFMDKNRQYFQKNPRLSMLLKTFDAMPEARKNELLSEARQYLDSLSS